MQAQNAELKKVRSFYKEENTKGEFERQFLQDFSFYFEQAQEAQRQMEQIFGEKGAQEGRWKGKRLSRRLRSPSRADHRQ